MISKIRYVVKNITTSLGLNYFSLKTWFRYLAIKNNVELVIDEKNNFIYISKNSKIIKLKKGISDFGSSGLVIRDFDSFFNAVEATLDSNGLQTVDFSELTLHKVKNSENSFYFHNICEPEHVTDLYIKKSNAKIGDVIFDVGAYCGTQSIYWSKIVGESGKVICFEPDSRNYDVLKKNIDLHNASNITALKLGLFSEDKTIYFSNNGSMGSQVIKEGNENTSEIQVRTLESIFKELNLTKLDFIKMDIEGSEMEVLKSSKEFIQKLKPSFIIEPHYINGVLNKDEIIDFFQSINFKVEILKQGGYDYQPLLYAYSK
jgi:FkbM family methyltransferase